MNEGIKVIGRLKVDSVINGVFTEGNWIENVITSAGKTALASLLNSSSLGTSLVTHIGFGTNSAAVSASDVALGTEMTSGTYAGYARVAVTRSNPSGNVIQYQATLTNVGGVPTIQECGLFNQATTGTLFAHQLSGAVTLSTTSDSLQITWQVTFP